MWKGFKTILWLMWRMSPQFLALRAPCGSPGVKQSFACLVGTVRRATSAFKKIIINVLYVELKISFPAFFVFLVQSRLIRHIYTLVLREELSADLKHIFEEILQWLLCNYFGVRILHFSSKYCFVWKAYSQIQVTGAYGQDSFFLLASPLIGLEVLRRCSYLSK